jgi:hypothetical protein
LHPLKIATTFISIILLNMMCRQMGETVHITVGVIIYFMFVIPVGVFIQDTFSKNNQSQPASS